MISLYIDIIPTPPYFCSIYKRKTAEHIRFALFIIIKNINLSFENSRTGMALTQFSLPFDIRPFGPKLANQ